ncbi:MAG: hypothetical protein COA84_14810 [Robiginitomaculum sp.]|nr:MAG: hypothetical protein COA84_14810 [Robiginitomaculum sp.]
MNRFEKQFCKEKISGYLIPRVNEGMEAAFNRARKETIDNYKKSIENLENFTYIEMISKDT